MFKKPIGRIANPLTLNQLFNGVLERDESDSFVERIAVAFVVNALDERHVPLLALLELFENHIERGIFEYEVALVLVESAQRFQWNRIFGID